MEKEEMLCKKDDINNNSTEQRKYLAEYAVLARCKAVSFGEQTV